MLIEMGLVKMLDTNILPSLNFVGGGDIRVGTLSNFLFLSSQDANINASEHLILSHLVLAYASHVEKIFSQEIQLSDLFTWNIHQFFPDVNLFKRLPISTESCSETICYRW